MCAKEYPSRKNDECVGGHKTDTFKTYKISDLLTRSSHEQIKNDNWILIQLSGELAMYSTRHFQSYKDIFAYQL